MHVKQTYSGIYFPLHYTYSDSFLQADHDSEKALQFRRRALKQILLDSLKTESLDPKINFS